VDQKERLRRTDSWVRIENTNKMLSTQRIYLIKSVETDSYSEVLTELGKTLRVGKWVEISRRDESALRTIRSGKTIGTQQGRETIRM
jgi:hypothetical protein